MKAMVLKQFSLAFRIIIRDFWSRIGIIFRGTNQLLEFSYNESGVE